MKKLLIIIALVGGGFHFYNNGGWSGGASSYSADGQAALKLVTFNSCGAVCDNAVDDLDRRGVEYSHYEVDPSDKSTEAYALWQDLGGGTFPIFVAGDGMIDGYHAPKLAGFLAHRLDESYLSDDEEFLLDDHFYASGEPMVVMYGAAWCGYCKKLRGELNSAGIDFMEIDADASADKEFIAQTLQVSGYPTMYVGYERVGNRLSDIKSVLSAY